MIAFFRFWFDLVLAFVAPRAALVAENLILRQQLIVVRRQMLWRASEAHREN